MNSVADTVVAKPVNVSLMELFEQYGEKPYPTKYNAVPPAADPIALADATLEIDTLNANEAKPAEYPNP